MTEVGYVISSRDFLVYLDGLPSVKINDMVESDQGLKGWVNSIRPDKVEVLMIDEGRISPGQLFRKMPTRLEIPIGNFLLGRSINPLGVPIDGKGMLAKSNQLKSLESPAPGIDQRLFINEQITTGVTVVDTLIPLGKGQRELVMGDAHSGKTGFLMNLIVNQKNTGIICIYASIGKTATGVKNTIDLLRVNKALPYTVIIAASSSEPAPLIYLTPKTAFTVAEYFQRQGRDVLLILDDMGNHAKIYREISLLGDKSPGRESYPGDIFYQHSHLLERAGKFAKSLGGGSITALPVIELNMNDFTTIIPTNLMSMTDGHLLFKSSLYNQGQRPAIDISLSVSRVGRQTQSHLGNLVAGRVRQLMSLVEELETVSRFSAELPISTQVTLRRGKLVTELLKQEPLELIPHPLQIILLGLTFTNFIVKHDQKYIEKNRPTIMQAFTTHPTLLKITQSLPQIKTFEELIKILESAGPTLESIVQS